MRQPPVFVISLPQSPRRAAMARQLEHWGGRWSFFDAVDGAALSGQQLRSVYDPVLAVRSFGRELSRPEIGCALSHRGVYDRILGERLPAAIVLEDDARLKAEFFRFPYDAVGPETDVLSFYSWRALVHRRPSGSLAGIALLRAAGWLDNTAGYLVTAGGAERLRRAAEPIRNPADWPVPPEHLRFLITEISLIDHGRHGSLVEAGRRAMERIGKPRHPLERWFDFRGSDYVTVPLFIAYALRRRRYLGVADYVRREIVRELKPLLPAYRWLSHGEG